MNVQNFRNITFYAILYNSEELWKLYETPESS